MLTLIHAMKMNHKREKCKARHASIRTNNFFVFVLNIVWLTHDLGAQDKWQRSKLYLY